MDLKQNSSRVQLGLRANWRQFTLLIVVNMFVGAMIGLERAVVPLIAKDEFGLASRAALSFIVSFGVVKAIANLFAGNFGDRWGRKRILVAGWLIGLPVPLLIILAPSWGWIVFANALLGVNQGLCWSTTVIMKIDLAGPQRRGLAMGLNEFAGYLAVSAVTLGSGYLAASYGLRPAPFYPGLIFALLGLFLSLFFVQETRQHAQTEAAQATAGEQGNAKRNLSFREVLLRTSWKDKTLFAASQAGLVNNLNDGMVWLLLPVFLAGFGLSLERISLLAATYPAVWGATQLFTGALSDRLGRKVFIVGGMLVQAAGIALLAWGRAFPTWFAAVVLLGLGTAMVYPTLLAAVSDVAEPRWRASAVGVYRLWRDGGYAVGALCAGLLASTWGSASAIAAIGALTLLSGLVVAVLMRETVPRQTPARTLTTVPARPDN